MILRDYFRENGSLALSPCRIMSAVTTFAIAQLSRPPSDGSSPEVILDLKISSGSEYLAAATSYGDICHLDPQTLQVIKRFKAHKQRIVDLDFVQPTNKLGNDAGGKNKSKGSDRSLGSFGPSILCSVGQDGLVAWWDLRLACKSPALKIQTDLPLTTGHIEPFGSNILATGSEKFNHESPICFWDVRHSAVPLARWTDFHNEDITMVRFHPDEPGCIVSSSIDGLLCRSHFDALLAPSEEYSLQSVIQTGCPIDRFNFTPISAAPDMVAVISPMRTASLVQLQAEEVVLNLGDVRDKTKADDDIISITSNTSTDCPIMFTSSQTGHVGAYLLQDASGNIEKVSSFGGVHSDAVRSMIYLQEHGIVYTGGEDSKVVAWGIN